MNSNRTLIKEKSTIFYLTTTTTKNSLKNEMNCVFLVPWALFVANTIAFRLCLCGVWDVAFSYNLW